MSVAKKATAQELEVSTETNCNQSKGYETTYFKSEDDESLEMKMSSDGLLRIKSVEIDKKITFDSIIISGFTPEQGKSMSIGFVRNLWKKVKKAVGDVLDAITFPIGPASCRPTVSVGTNRGRITSVYIGINCFN
ncbi:hypothetical protein LCGC14_0785670 [marine sediment metagenome]|uniref:Uncharacterized protein n=1 Tax=marine sediment metagenome TaxID=412755 RepID=A0A0F9PU86_9ZZZZ|nr:hypothetical protein [Maribacter sp.]HDZ03414.1 hypothetical protein [Maribacter sp.]